MDRPPTVLSPGHPPVLAQDEPEGGWVAAPEKVTTPITAITLCQYTGEKIGADGVCLARDVNHPDTNCVMLYFSASAIAQGRVDLELAAPVVRDELYEGIPDAPQ